MKRVLSLLLACVSISTSAHADWQYTKWGMTPTQVAQASGGLTHLTADTPDMHIEGMTLGDTGSYKSANTSFTSAFYFADNKLALVKLSTNAPPECYGLIDILKSNYGEPFYVSPAKFLTDITWKVADAGNSVRIMAIHDDCYLDYTPIATSANGGL